MTARFGWKRDLIDLEGGVGYLATCGTTITSERYFAILEEHPAFTALSINNWLMDTLELGEGLKLERKFNALE